MPVVVLELDPQAALPWQIEFRRSGWYRAFVTDTIAGLTPAGLTPVVPFEVAHLVADPFNHAAGLKDWTMLAR